jgi:hypothetical protein
VKNGEPAAESWFAIFIFRQVANCSKKPFLLNVCAWVYAAFGMAVGHAQRNLKQIFLRKICYYKKAFMLQ